MDVAGQLAGQYFRAVTQTKNIPRFPTEFRWEIFPVQERATKGGTHNSSSSSNSSSDMGLFFLVSVLAAVLLSSHQQLFCAAGDRLAAGQSMSVNQTIVSAGQIFALGFFTPENSTSANLHYAGIWYNNLPGRTVVWVANRENPLKDRAGVLAVTGDGNIVVLDGAGRIVWSTNLSGIPSNTSAVLLDSGNLVLRHDVGSEVDVWQSFQHPTDTVLPGMKLRSNLSSGVGTRVTSWKGESDPFPGQFVMTLDPRNSLQLIFLKGSDMYARTIPWNGKPAITLQLSNLTSILVGTVVKEDDEILVTFNMLENSMIARFVLDYAGIWSFFSWVESQQNWVTLVSLPKRPCDFYSRCGPFGACAYAQSSCSCLDGFEPRSPEEWKRGNFTAGCVRQLQLQCDGTDRFVKVLGLRLPDGFSVMWNKSMQQCEAECSARCGCQGYAHAELSTLDARFLGSKCLIWLAEMEDLKQAPGTSEDFYVRLPASGLEGHTRLEDGVISNKNKRLIRIIIPILSFGMLLTGICFYFFIRRRKARVGKSRTRQSVRRQGSAGSEKEMPDVALFDFKSVKAATSNFCSENKLGQGGFGPVYKGRFLNGQDIAVKRLSKSSKQGYQEFHNEVRLIARLQHKNLVRLLGWCMHKSENILIYEYMPNKSLDNFIFDSTRLVELNWKKRFGIIKGIANGLLYLHEYSRMRVIHRDLKTSNILLDSEMNPKISDFGLARAFRTDQDIANTQRVVGTYGYMSPEYALNGVFSEKSDVFSFGVILLEIITGKKSTGFYPDSNSQSLLGYAWQMWEGGRGFELLDPSMLSSSSSATEVPICTQLAMLCIQEDAADRPTMSSVVFSLSNDVCTLPMPKKPAFVFERSPNSVLSAAHDSASKASINGLTATSVQGR